MLIGGALKHQTRQNMKLTPMKVALAARLTHGAHFESGGKNR